VDDGQVLRLMLTAGLSVAAWGAVVALVLYAVGRAGRHPLLSPVRPLQPAWNGFAVVGAFAAWFIAGAIVHTALAASGFFQRVYGPDFPADLPSDPTEAQRAAATIRALWTAAIAFPVQVGLIAWVLWAQGGDNPFRRRSWQMHVVSGYLTWLLVTPAAFCVFVLAIAAHSALTGQPPDKHPLTILGAAAGNWEWALFVLQTVVLAPVLEELLFRGLLLPWLAQRRPVPPETPLTVPPSRRALVVMLLAVGAAVIFQLDEIEKARVEGDYYAAAAHLVPGAFFLALVPLLYVLPRLGGLRRHLRIRGTRDVRAILASSALFAAFHAAVWPSPVPLVVLAVGLGYLYLRTRSLIGPIVVHGLFNAVSVVYLLLGGKV
jgi:membrane protease YdiL (CAAX protease family)